MSRAGNDNATGDAAPEVVREEEEDYFHDSLDRVLSSSNSSTSASENEDAVFNSPPHSHHYHHTATSNRANVTAKLRPRIPVSIRNYDVWISDALFSSSSLQQRRDRLLRALGLSSDPALSRRKPYLSDSSAFDFSRSVVSDRFTATDARTSRIHPDSSIAPIFRSKSEGDCQTSNPKTTLEFEDVCNSTASASNCSPGAILSTHPASDYAVNSNAPIRGGNFHLRGVVDNLTTDISSGDVDRENDEIQRDSALSGPTLSSDVLKGGSGSFGMDAKCNGTEDARVEMCTIKNLDTGTEFVVNEVREDGMWKKLREVGTGKQLTMEEFEISFGHSPIVQELMRRQNVEELAKDKSDSNANGNVENGTKSKKVSWFKSFKNVASSVAGHKERRNSDDMDTSSEKGGRRSSSATDDGQDVSFHGPERVRVRQYGKSVKELTALYKSQEIQAHNGSIWSIKFSVDGMYLASAGEDCLIHVWQVKESERKGRLLMDRPDDSSLSFLLLTNGPPVPHSLTPSLESPLEGRRRGRTSIGRKSLSLDHVLIPEAVFGLSEKPICSFQGHLDDVLDLSWSKSQLLLSSSMDKTVRLWSLSSKTCLKIFSHSDFVTCIQFNPVDDRYFISGSLDAKVRIWSIPDHQVVDYNDLHEMVTAACYTPDGQAALVGSYKGSCRLYNTSENKLQEKSQINLQNKKKKAHLKKITGFQFAPGSSSEVLITSADSRVRVVDGVDLVHKLKGFRNSNSQISASITTNGKHVVCASDDSHVYVWKHEGESRPGKTRGVTVTSSYEHFHCRHVSVAIPWPGITDSWTSTEPNRACHTPLDDELTNNHPPTPLEDLAGLEGKTSGCDSSNPFRRTISSGTNSYFLDRLSANWPGERLLLADKNLSPRPSLDMSNGVMQNRSAWGMVIVTAGLRGEIRTFLNFGLPFRV